jgi:3-oxoacyl-[acyl-carrier protein] reductase
MMQMSDDEYDILMNVNLRAAFMATRAALRPMIRNKFGRIISISSVAGVFGQAGSANYAASKAGLIGMTKSVVREVAKKGITANCVAPGFIATEMTAVLPDIVKEAALAIIPAKKMGTPEDVAKAVAFLASDESGYINGQVLHVDGGMAFV